MWYLYTIMYLQLIHVLYLHIGIDVDINHHFTDIHLPSRMSCYTHLIPILIQKEGGQYMDLQLNLSSAQQSLSRVRRVSQVPCNMVEVEVKRHSVFSLTPKRLRRTLSQESLNYSRKKLLRCHSPALRITQTDRSLYPLATTKWFHAVSL